MAANHLLRASFVLAMIAGCGGQQRSNIIGQPDLTQEELDAVTAQASGSSVARVESQRDQTELAVSEKPPPPPKKPPRPRKMDAPAPLTHGKKVSPASPSPAAPASAHP